jgi:hypothetical protein
MSDDSSAAPRPTAADHLHTLARAGISAIPVVGGPGVELFEMILPPALDKRKRDWMDSVGEALERLEAKFGNILDDLKSDDAFIDTVMQASQAAIKTSEQEKLEALRNAVLNSAAPSPPDLSRRQIFISWVDTLTPWHLRMLRLFADPMKWYQEQKRQPPQFHISGSLAALLTDAYPELKSERDFYDKVCKDLYNDGLIKSEHLHVMMSGSGPFEHRATPLGNQFLQFITDPTT